MTPMDALRESLYQAGIKQLQADEMDARYQHFLAGNVAHGVGFENQGVNANGELVITRRQYRDAPAT